MQYVPIIAGTDVAAESQLRLPDFILELCRLQTSQVVLPTPCFLALLHPALASAKALTHKFPTASWPSPKPGIAARRLHLGAKSTGTNTNLLRTSTARRSKPQKDRSLFFCPFCLGTSFRTSNYKDKQFLLSYGHELRRILMSYICMVAVQNVGDIEKKLTKLDLNLKTIDSHYLTS